MHRYIKIIWNAFATTAGWLSSVLAFLSPIVEGEFSLSFYSLIKDYFIAKLLLFLIALVCFVLVLVFHSLPLYPSRKLKGTYAQNTGGLYFFPKDRAIVRDSIVEIYQQDGRFGDKVLALASVDRVSERNERVMIFKHLAYYDEISQTFDVNMEFKDIKKSDLKNYRYRHRVSVNPALHGENKKGVA